MELHPKIVKFSIELYFSGTTNIWAEQKNWRYNNVVFALYKQNWSWTSSIAAQVSLKMEDCLVLSVECLVFEYNVIPFKKKFAWEILFCKWLVYFNQKKSGVLYMICLPCKFAKLVNLLFILTEYFLLRKMIKLSSQHWRFVQKHHVFKILIVHYTIPWYYRRWTLKKNQQ